MAAETSQTLDRGLRVLEVLAATPAGLTVTELSAALGINRTVTHRLVTTLAEHALVRRDEAGRVTAGLGLLRLAVGVQPVLRDATLPLLRELAEVTGCTAHLTVVDSGEALALAVVEPSWTDFHVSYRVGARHPLEQGAAGRAILAGRSGTGGPVVSDGELQAGAHGLAAPVLGVLGLEASIGVITLGSLEADKVGPAVGAAVAALVQRLG
ncbi:IclR family transcriptional regulator [Nocardioides sp. Bht2]|uniref:IclR family transcriptional regulator n=1 Tax=Nocardioides sp. Bht2 TaxID=3392297 RepID=UPI0039B37A09